MGDGNKKERKRRSDEGSKDGFEAWGGYMNAKITKLEEQYEEESKRLGSSEKLSNIFEGVAVFVNGYTEPSSEDLRLLMLLHGGIYHHYYRSEKTTHVIASNLPNAKMVQLKTMKVVKPDWIVKSIEAGRLLDYKNFLLFSKPSIFQAHRMKVDNKDEGKISDTNNEQPAGRQQNVAKTAVDAQFLSEFYSNSRLHHLSTMGAMFKQYVGELKDRHNGEFPGRRRILEWVEKEVDGPVKTDITDKAIMHIDMDCFFVSVALRNHPELVGKPVAVAHARGNPTHQRMGVDSKFEYEFYKKKMEVKMGLENDSTSDDDDDDQTSKPWLSEFSSRSEVASCSYEARKAGVRNGMYLGSALKLCPDLKTVPYDFEGYKEVSYTLYNTVAEYTLDIEAVSCDELFIDCTSLLRDVRVKPLDFATMLRTDIRDRTRCPSSVGIGSNKLQARLATKRAKPNGQFHLQSVEVLNFMNDVSVYDLPGVGRSIGYKLKTLNVRTCGDLQDVPLAKLKKEFGGKTGETLYKHCRGEDDRAVKSEHQRKSVSAEVNYGIRFSKEEEAITFLKQLSAEVSNRLKEINMKGRNITFKVMIRAKDAPVEAAKFLGHGACDYVTRSYQLPHTTNDEDLIAKHVVIMYRQLSVPACELRGIGIQITKLESCRQVTGILKNFLKPKEELKRPVGPGTSTDMRQNKPQDEKPAPSVNKLQLPSLSQIDASVLESLPTELKLEIMNEYGITDVDVLKKQAPPVATVTPSQIEPKTFDELPSSIKQEIEEAVGKPKDRSAFCRLSLTQMRTMVSEWVTAEAKPKKFDGDMLMKYLCELVEKRQIDDVDILVKCFRRHIQCKRNGEMAWRNCYREVVKGVQVSMREAFGKEMWIEEV